MIRSLSYLGFESPEAESWANFGTTVLGLELVGAENGSVKLAMDDIHHRFTFVHAQRDRLAWIGWDVGNQDSLAETEKRLLHAGVEILQGNDAQIADRCVIDMRYFIDCFGLRHELAYGMSKPLRPPILRRFVTANQGFGHLFVIVPDQKQAEDLFGRILGLHIDGIIRGHGLDATFFNCNARHHSIASMELLGHRGVHHVMLELADLDDLGRAYDYCQDNSIPIVLSLGRHTNDQMLSFYIETPSQFQVELGWGGLTVTGEESMVLYDAPGRWGHRQLVEHLPMAIERID